MTVQLVDLEIYLEEGRDQKKHCCDCWVKFPSLNRLPCPESHKMTEKNGFILLFGLFMILTSRDIFFGQSGQDAEVDGTKSSIPNEHLHHASLGSAALKDSHHMGNFLGTPTVRIQYCHSCGYRQAFDEISKMLQMHYPEIKIIGDLHQPSWFRGQLVNVLFMAKIAVLALIHLDINPFTYFQMDTPSIWAYMTRSKLSSSLMILFVANSIESNMMSTGAFEIFYNDMPVWSKIQTGRMPSGPELLQIVQSHSSLGQKSRLGEFVPT